MDAWLLNNSESLKRIAPTKLEPQTPALQKSGSLGIVKIVVPFEFFSGNVIFSTILHCCFDTFSYDRRNPAMRTVKPVLENDKARGELL